MKKLLLLTALACSMSVYAQQKVIKVNARVSGTMITFSLYQKQTDDSYLLIDSKDEDSGLWTFDSLDAGIYRVHQSMAYAKYIPTWHPMKAVWDEAGDINLTSADTALCDEGMLPNLAVSGPASISGELIEGVFKAQGDPLKNVRVVIKDANNVLVKMTSTNDSGKFNATSLPVGSYKIIVDMVNVPTANPKTVVLDSSNLTASVDLTVNSSGTVSTGMKKVASSSAAIKLYPNPASDYVNITSTEEASITVYNITGLLVAKGSISRFQPLSIQHLTQGIYFATVEKGNVVETYRIIKQ